LLGQCCDAVPAPLQVPPVSCPHAVLSQRLAVEAEAMASFGQKQANQPGLWSAMDATTRPSMAVHVGDRRHTSAEPLGAKMPQASRPPATCSPEHYVVDAKVMPAVPHTASSTLARTTKHIERCTTTLRQRVSRLGREAVALSKQLPHHIGASKLCICHYNLTRAAA
jgi:IS1 family transposase